MIYRLYRQPIYSSEVTGCLDYNWKATTICFNARNEKEAMKKANKFWQEGFFGMGSITVKKESATKASFR